MDWLSFIAPTLALAASYTAAALVFRKLPDGLSFLNFHVIAYPTLFGLNLLLVLVMAVVPLVDLHVDDASVFFAIGFGGLGLLISLVLAPLAWVIERRRPLGPLGRSAANVLVSVPYIAAALVLLLYRE